MSTPGLGKRKRGNNEDTHFPDVETAETTTELGLKIVGQLKRSTDKNGREIADAFLDLPNRSDYPSYYQTTLMPLSIHMIEQRLEARHYTNMEQLEGDLKRLVQNAKEYNDTRSEVFADAERIRKALSNFMPRHNPAYLNPDYKAVPTPIPQALLDRMRDSSVSTSGTGRVKIKLKSSRLSMAPSATPEVEELEEDHQDSMMTMLEELSVQDGAVNFEERPPKRDYPDYYKIIERPTSISDVKTMVGQNKIVDWNALAQEVRLVWKNAKEYNEPGSDIYDITEQLEAWFEEQVQAAGADSPKLPQRLSLSQPKKLGLKLKMGGSTPSASIAGGAIDNASLERQRDETAQALGRARGVPTPAPSTAPSMTRSLSSVEPNGDVIMSGTNGTAPVTPGLAGSNTQGSIPPQKQSTPLLNGTSTSQPQTNGVHHALTRSAFAPSDNPMDRKFRDAGKDLTTTLLSSVSYNTHPNLPGDPKWALTISASPTRTQSTSFVYLPATHYYFRLTPQLNTPEMKHRENWKLCVSANWQPVPNSPHMPGTYDFRLQPGENTIVVDVIAQLRSGEWKEGVPAQMQFDFERICLVVILADRTDG